MTFAILVAAIFVVLFGALRWRAGQIRARHSDLVAAFPLYAVRDQLVRLVITGAITRRDPWLECLYTGTNMLLLHCNVVACPAGIEDATAAGRLQAEAPELFVELPEIPGGMLPEQLLPVAGDLVAALEQLGAGHGGLRMQFMAYAATKEHQEHRQARMKAATEFSAALAHYLPAT